MKKILSGFASLALVVLFSYAIAYAVPTPDVPPAPPAPIDGSAQLATQQMNLIMANVAVENVHVDKREYNAGDEIKGDFTISNYSNVNLEGLNYRVLIGTEYDGTEDAKVTNQFLDASTLISIGTLNVGETKTIPFSYKIPLYVGGKKLAAQIDIYNSSDGTIGENSGPFINIKSQTASVEVSQDKIVMSNGAQYDLGEGPTIYKDKDPRNASVSLMLKNVTKDTVPVTASVKVYNQSDKTNTESFDLTLAQLKPLESKKVEINLPDMKYASGVYFAEIVLKDGQGRQLASRLGARYIVGGDMATIHSVQTDLLDVQKGNVFNLTYSISGRPFDIAHRIDMSKVPASLKTKEDQSDKTKKDGLVTFDIYNESGQRVAIYNAPFALYDSNSDVVSVVAERSAQAMRAVVTIYDENGTAFFTKEIKLRADYDDVVAQIMKERKRVQLGEVVLLILVLATVLFLVRRRKGNMSMVNLFILGFVLIIPTATEAWIWTGTPFNCSMEDTTGSPSVSVYQPYDNYHYPEGSFIKLYGSASILACGNSGYTLTMYFYNSGDGSTGTRVFSSQGATGKHSYFNVSATFQSRQVNVGTKAGSQKMTFWISDGCHVVNGYVPYYVSCGAGRVVGAGGYCTNAPTPVSGACGSMNGAYYTGSVPTNTSATGYCAAGSLGAVTTAGDTTSWSCTGSNGGTNASCSYRVMQNTCTAVGGCTGTTTTTTTTYTGTSTSGSSAMCGTKTNSSVASGSTITSSTSNLCSSGSSVSGTISFNYLNNEWRWTCSTGSNNAYCKTSCAAGLYLCPSTNTCSSSCNDWCPNQEGNQTERTAYTIDESGQCNPANLITNFNLSPSITNSQGVCKAFWSTTNPTTDEMTCKINGTTVACANAVGYNILPGVVRFEAYITATDPKTNATSTVVTDAEDLRCTKNPNLIEI